MRIVATSDTHFPFSADRFPEGDVLIHAGDLMYTGLPQEFNPLLDSFANLSYKHKYYVPGNHDYHLERYEGLARAELRKVRVKTVGTHPDFAITKLPNGMKMLGVPYVTGLNGWAFCRTEDWVYNYMQNLDFDNNYCEVVVSHAPMYGIGDNVGNPPSRPHKHVGSMSLNRWYHGLKRKPLVWINGHIHEGYGRYFTEEGTACYNVAMCDRHYQQTNAPMVIDLGD